MALVLNHRQFRSFNY